MPSLISFFILQYKHCKLQIKDTALTVSYNVFALRYGLVVNRRVIVETKITPNASVPAYPRVSMHV